MRLQLNSEWQVGYNSSPNQMPQEMIPAKVPGAVQLDWATAKGYGLYTYADNWKDYEWMEDVYWTYSTIVPSTELNPGQKLYFVSKGIDYQFQVFVNQDKVYEQEGMFTPFELDLTKYTGADLSIQVFPAPKRDGAQGNKQPDQSCKPAVSYGWDWHPRLVPLGIWDDTYFEVRNATYIQDAEVRYELSNDYKSADLTLNLELSDSSDNTIALWSFTDADGAIVFEKELNPHNTTSKVTCHLDNINLWWPNGEGEAYLYNSTVTLSDSNKVVLDESNSKVGLRNVQLIMHPTAWQSPLGHPISRSNAPITLEINGQSIFCKGTNWVNPEIFPGTITKETYRPLLQFAKDAHFNLLRTWGGAIVNKKSFFELCDEMGLMVWQEFPLACNNYEGTPHYLQILDQESKSILRRLRRHTCIAMWCGGNELFNAWSGMTDQSLALRLLNRNCYDLDPKTPFLMTSPLEGMAHGNYLFRYQDGREVFQAMPQANNTAYTEFGVPGTPSVEYLKSFIPEDQLFPPKPGTVWQTHHAFDAWIVDTWLQPQLLESYFGKIESLEQLVECSQLLQCEGYKCIYEEARRQKPTCSMALNWCYNEPWPTAANNSIISWPAEPKPAYFAVKNACRPVLASIRIPKFSYRKDELLSVEMWILNDSPQVVPAGRIDAVLKMDDQFIPLKNWNYPPLAPRENISGPNIRFILPESDCKQMSIILKNLEDPSMDSEYILLYTK